MSSNGNDDDYPISRRDLTKGLGALTVGVGALYTEEVREFFSGPEDREEESPVDQDNGDDPGSGTDGDSFGGDQPSDQDTDYSQELCDAHSELDPDVQRDIEGYLGIVDEVDDTSIYELEVSGKYIDTPSERFAPVEITGTQGGQDQFGASDEYAEILEEAYNEDEEEFHNGLEDILEGECR